VSFLDQPLIPNGRVTRRRLLRDSLVIFGVAWFVIGWFVLRYPIDFLNDARAYYHVDSVAPYGGSVGVKGTFTYSPPLAAVFVGLRVLPEPVFLAGWLALNVGLAVWLFRRQPLVALMLAMPISDLILTGQIEFLMIAGIVLMRPTGWVLPILAKSTTGVGLLWYVVRREWRSLATALGVIGAICLVSVLLTPGWWVDWFAFLGRSAAGNPQLLPLRLALAAVVVVWGARTDRAWVLPVAVVLALPVVWMHSLAMLGAATLLNHRTGDLVPSPRVTSVAGASA
jgi:hypothetical protein